MHFARVQADKPDLLDIQLGLLLACMAQGTWNAALARLVLGALPESAATDLSSALSAAPAFLKLGVSLIHRQVLSCAQIAFSCAVMGGQQDPRGAPVVTQARRCLGELHTTLGQSWKAVEQYESLLKANPNDGEAFQRLGDCYTRLGVEDAAGMCYERSRQLGAV